MTVAYLLQFLQTWAKLTIPRGDEKIYSEGGKFGSGGGFMEAPVWAEPLLFWGRKDSVIILLSPELKSYSGFERVGNILPRICMPLARASAIDVPDPFTT